MKTNREIVQALNQALSNSTTTLQMLLKELDQKQKVIDVLKQELRDANDALGNIISMVEDCDENEAVYIAKQAKFGTKQALARADELEKES